MLPRNLADSVRSALVDTPVVFLQGARQTRKSTLVTHLTGADPPARYLTLDDAGTLAAAQSDPQGFIENATGPIGGREHAVHEPLISSVIVEERDGPSAGAGTAGAAGRQASGFFHARPGKRAKSPSVEQSRQPCSIASAAR
jgi:hypothetical protein